MSFRKTTFIIAMAFGLLSACGEKNPKEIKVDAAEMEKAAEKVREEAAAKAADIEAAKQRVADSLKKIDSLQQVKEHGHAH